MHRIFRHPAFIFGITTIATATCAFGAEYWFHTGSWIACIIAFSTTLAFTVIRSFIRDFLRTQRTKEVFTLLRERRLIRDARSSLEKRLTRTSGMYSLRPVRISEIDMTVPPSLATPERVEHLRVEMTQVRTMNVQIERISQRLRVLWRHHPDLAPLDTDVDWDDNLDRTSSIPPSAS